VDPLSVDPRRAGAAGPERAAPVLPLQPGIAEKCSHDYVRHGTTNAVRRPGGGHRQGH